MDHNRGTYRYLTTDDYTRSVSFLYVSKYTDMCMDMCMIHPRNDIELVRPDNDISNRDRDCISSCMDNIRPVYRRIQREWSASLLSMFNDQE